MPVLTIKIVQDCFYLLNIFYSEKFSTWLWRLPFLVHENRNLSIGNATPSSPPKGGVFAPFWSENGYRLCSFWSGNGYGFRTEVAWGQAGAVGKKGKKRGQIGKLWGKGRPPFTLHRLPLGSLRQLAFFFFFFLALADYFSLPPQCGACPQAKLRKLQERMN